MWSLGRFQLRTQHARLIVILINTSTFQLDCLLSRNTIRDGREIPHELDLRIINIAVFHLPFLKRKFIYYFRFIFLITYNHAMLKRQCHSYIINCYRFCCPKTFFHNYIKFSGDKNCHLRLRSNIETQKALFKI